MKGSLQIVTSFVVILASRRSYGLAIYAVDASICLAESGSECSGASLPLAAALATATDDGIMERYAPKVNIESPHYENPAGMSPEKRMYYVGDTVEF